MVDVRSQSKCVAKLATHFLRLVNIGDMSDRPTPHNYEIDDGPTKLSFENRMEDGKTEL